MIKPEDRLTYKSMCGDFGGAKLYENNYEELCALRNALGKYEEIGATPDEVLEMIEMCKSKSEIQK